MDSIEQYERRRTNRIRLAVAAVGIAIGVGLGAFINAQASEPPVAMDAPIIINLDKVLAVHYGARIPEARKHFEDAGFQGVRNLGYHPIPDWDWLRKRGPGDMQIPCNLARKLVRDLDRKGEGTSFYQGDLDWSASLCNVYHFSADAYVGPPGDLGRDFP